MLGGIAVSVYLLVQLVFLPVEASVGSLNSTIKSREEDLSELKSIVAEYGRLEAGREKGEVADIEGFNLFSTLEKIATQSGLMDKIDYMKPGSLPLDSLREERWVEVKFSRLTLREMTDYLYNLKAAAGGISVKRLSLRTDGEYLELTLQPAVIEMK